MSRPHTTIPLILVLSAGMAACEKRDASTGSRSTASSSAANGAPTEKPTKPDAVDQGNSQAELDVTQAIRKAVQARDDVSAGTKSALVIVTDKTRVTLKGPVASEAEKTAIGDVATSNAAGRTIDNQLAVKPASP